MGGLSLRCRFLNVTRRNDRSFEEGYTKFEVAVYKTVGEKFIPGKKEEEEEVLLAANE